MKIALKFTYNLSGQDACIFLNFVSQTLSLSNLKRNVFELITNYGIHCILQFLFLHQAADHSTQKYPEISTLSIEWPL